MLIVSDVFALAAAVGVSVAVGRVGGGLVSCLCQLCRRRNAGVIGKAAVVNGLAVYAGHLLVRLATSGRLPPLITIYPKRSGDGVAIQVTHETPQWIAVVILAELLLVANGAYVEATGRIEDATSDTEEGQAFV